MKARILLASLISCTLITTVHAGSFFDTLTAPASASGTTEKLQVYVDQYTNIDRILREHPMAINTKKRLLTEKSRVAKMIRTLQGTYLIENGEPGIGGYSIYPLLQFHDIQSYALSCESSATATILTYLLGKTVTENEVISQLSPSFYGVGKSTSGIWGNPDIGFVGDINGGQRKLTGFGVYEKPLTRIYSTYHLRTEIINNLTYNTGTNTGTHMNKLFTALESGKAVQMWGDYCTSRDAEDGVIADTTQVLVDAFGLSSKNGCSSEASARTLEWNTYDSNLNTSPIIALNGEHNFVLLGWKGIKEKPTHIIVWDTYTGKHIYPVAEWFKKWGAVNNRSIIISK